MKTTLPTKSLLSPKDNILPGGIHTDERGSIHFVNDFNFPNIKRFYMVENFNCETIRAFHGHKKEAKFVYVPQGAILLCAVFIDNFKNPSKQLPVKRFVLSDKKSEILSIPPHFANGWKALEKNTKVLFFSTSTLASSLVDDFRFPYDYWGADIWKIPNT